MGPLIDLWHVSTCMCERSEHECMQVALTAHAGTAGASNLSFGGAEE